MIRIKLERKSDWWTAFTGGGLHRANGQNPLEALGNLVHRYPEEFGVEFIEFPDPFEED